MKNLWLFRITEYMIEAGPNRLNSLDAEALGSIATAVTCWRKGGCNNEVCDVVEMCRGVGGQLDELATVPEDEGRDVSDYDSPSA